MYNHPSTTRNEMTLYENIRASELSGRLINRILVPVDGSSNSHCALEFAIDLAEKYSAEICLLHVISVMPIYSLSSWEPFPPPLYMVESEDEGERVLASASNKVDTADLRSTAWLDYGQPAGRIVQAAKEKDVDLIVMGCENRSFIAKLFLGSVSDQVSHHAPCPVLIVKESTEKDKAKEEGRSI